MDVDQDARRPTVGSQPLSHRLLSCACGGKRRRLNDVDDEDTRELAELLLEEEDEAGTKLPAPRLSAPALARLRPLRVRRHNAQRFQCSLCTYHGRQLSRSVQATTRTPRHLPPAFLGPVLGGGLVRAACPSRRGWLLRTTHMRAPASTAQLRQRLRRQQGN
ncbi:hypothetical protein PF003_g34465 [Phytophthora fragariae]|nr:hypothetical protein PF003_g34465 [Phytophthora fragariae]